MVHIIANHAEFTEQLSQASSGGKAVVVDFFAEWCGPCKMIAPFFEALSKTYASVVFLKVDVDIVPTVAEQAHVSAMPTFQVWKDNAKVDELVGASKEKLEALIKKYA